MLTLLPGTEVSSPPLVLAKRLRQFQGEARLHTGRGDAGYLAHPRDPAVRIPVRTRYATDLVERWSHEIVVEAGRLLAHATFEPFRTAGMYPGLLPWDGNRTPNRAIYAMAYDGTIYAGDPGDLSPDLQDWRAARRDPGVDVPDSVEVWHHSSFVAGEGVVCAGDLETDTTGRLVAISNFSGHYRPSVRNLLAAVRQLAEREVPMAGVVVEAITPDRRLHAYDAAEFLAARGDTSRLVDRISAHRQALAIRAVERATRRPFPAAARALFAEAAEIWQADAARLGFDAEKQPHWNWLARWCADGDPAVTARLRQVA